MSEEQKMVPMQIRETTNADLNDILLIQREAFNSDKEANITKELLTDPSAKPRLSLIAFSNDLPAGHILFTAGHLLDASKKVAISFLAPLGVKPRFQRQGIGSNLIRKGLELLSKSNFDLVFVVGHPKYYPRHGFMPAHKLGFQPTYAIPEEHDDAWMVQALRPDVIGSVSGKVICCAALNKPELWRE